MTGAQRWVKVLSSSNFEYDLSGTELCSKIYEHLIEWCSKRNSVSLIDRGDRTSIGLCSESATCAFWP